MKYTILFVFLCSFVNAQVKYSLSKLHYELPKNINVFLDKSTQVFYLDENKKCLAIINEVNNEDIPNLDNEDYNVKEKGNFLLSKISSKLQNFVNISDEKSSYQILNPPQFIPNIKTNIIFYNFYHNMTENKQTFKVLNSIMIIPNKEKSYILSINTFEMCSNIRQFLQQLTESITLE